MMNMSWHAAFLQRCIDQTDDITAGASAAKPAAGMAGIAEAQFSARHAIRRSDAEQFQAGNKADRNNGTRLQGWS